MPPLGIPRVLSEEERAKLAKENAKKSAEAFHQAAEAQSRDIRNGQRPVEVDVGESLKDRLKRERPGLVAALEGETEVEEEQEQQ